MCLLLDPPVCMYFYDNDDKVVVVEGKNPV